MLSREIDNYRNKLPDNIPQAAMGSFVISAAIGAIYKDTPREIFTNSTLSACASSLESFLRPVTLISVNAIPGMDGELGEWYARSLSIVLSLAAVNIVANSVGMPCSQPLDTSWKSLTKLSFAFAAFAAPMKKRGLVFTL